MNPKSRARLGCRFTVIGGRLVLLFLIAALLACAAGPRSGNADNLPPGERVTLSGKVLLIGNEPFTMPAVETEDGTVYRIIGPGSKELKRMQLNYIEISGLISKEGGAEETIRINDAQDFKVIKRGSNE
jgi:hypothetical protein